MTNQLQVFKDANFGRLRTLTINNEPWFVGKDVAEALGYVDAKRAILQHIDDDDKQILRGQNTTFEIPNRGLTIINESGLYSLIVSSKLPTAKSFKRWVTSEILPAIRKTGYFSVKEPVLSLPDFTNPVIAARAWADAQEAKQIAEAHIEQLAPKAQMADDFMLAEGSVNFTALCNMLEIKNRKKFRDFLVKNKWCYKNNRQNTKKPWIACVSKVRSGLLVTKAFVNNAFTSTCLYWTLEGINLIKEQMILDEYEY